MWRSLGEKGDKSCADPRGPVRRLWRIELLEQLCGDDVGFDGAGGDGAGGDGAGGDGRAGGGGADGAGGESAPPVQRVAIVLEGDRFLRKMARMLAGTLVQVGSGRLRPEDVGAILRGGTRTAAVVTAPAAGLMLDRVFYETEPPALRRGSMAPAAAPLPAWPVTTDVAVPKRDQGREHETVPSDCE